MRIDPRDNVEVSLETGHKTALTDIKEGESIIKYGFPIGHATKDIKRGAGAYHNLKTNLEVVVEYTYTPREIKEQEADCGRTFMGYEREDGSVGIRTRWIINTVGCINRSRSGLPKRPAPRALPIHSAARTWGRF